MAFGMALSWMWAPVDFLWAQEPVYDIVIRDGRIVDGTDNCQILSHDQVNPLSLAF